MAFADCLFFFVCNPGNLVLLHVIISLHVRPHPHVRITLTHYCILHHSHSVLIIIELLVLLALARSLGRIETHTGLNTGQRIHSE